MSVPNFITTGDGTRRDLREGQIIAFSGLMEKWNQHDNFAVVCPTGGGKSLISRTIQKATNGRIVTISKMLQKQYVKDYPELNAVMGKAEYKKEADYFTAQGRAVRGEHSVWNPMSLFYFVKHRGSSDEVDTGVTILDEADQMIGLLMQCATFSRAIRNKNWQAIEWNDSNILDFLDKNIEATSRARMKEVTREEKIARLEAIREAFLEAPEQFAVWVDPPGTGNAKTFPVVNIKPIFLPRSIARKVLGTGKVIMLSATLFESDINELLGFKANCVKIEVPSPIPVAQRTVVYDPAPCEMHYQDRDPFVIAQHIKDVHDKYPGVNSLIHATYDMARKLQIMLGVKYKSHNKDTKQEVLNDFMENGGALLGAGMDTGLDLKDDMCRLCIITCIRYPNLGDTWVQKKLAYPGGWNWYNTQALRYVIQCAGRAVRGPNDYAVIVCIDSRLRSLLYKNKHQVPEYFKNSIQWYRNARRMAV